ncbi:hypothetical protein ICM05_01195 [Leucobacter sp. cx-42]|uniref:hypothetical protein n=1 Tax=unclassified Leucobacter TaxID=2621730 RepID=UPI00165E15CE|nr:MULTISPECIES: hypothetical protein [unclassified Leucobacter]MBC9953264.1 hypothetical protein [Leucobacter sp. cx-42]
MSGFDYKAELDAVRARIIADTNRRCVAAWDRTHAETPGERAEREPVAKPSAWRAFMESISRAVANIWRHRE